MKAEEFIKQQIIAGYKIHVHDGVWWQMVMPFYYKPVLQLQVIEPGVARPKITAFPLGYSHLVSSRTSANKTWTVLEISDGKLKNFSIGSLDSSKRARVRKGLRNNEIKTIEKIEPALEGMQRICISAAKRTGHGKPPEYYTKRFKEWKDFIIKEFSLPDRQWWGAFNKGELVAYYYAHQVEGVMFINAAKSHSDFLDTCPNDALLFTFLEHCKNLGDCDRVIFGDWAEDVPSLNAFKEKFGFEKVDLPVYRWVNPLVRIVRTGLERVKS